MTNIDEYAYSDRLINVAKYDTYLKTYKVKKLNENSSPIQNAASTCRPLYFFSNP